MRDFIKSRIQRARKQYTCCWCEQPVIQPGDLHIYLVGYQDYSFGCNRWCERCGRRLCRWPEGSEERSQA